jgi:elongation factor G
VDDKIADLFLNEKEPNESQLQDSIRQATISLKFSPVMLGSAFKNRGVQNLLDGIGMYLPNPAEVENYVLQEEEEGQKKIKLLPDEKAPFIGLGFKLEESRFGQLTYVRVYQGTLRKGSLIYNTRDRHRVKVPRLVRMHANEMGDIDEIKAGDICAIFGVDCHSGDTFTDSE